MSLVQSLQNSVLVREGREPVCTGGGCRLPSCTHSVRCCAMALCCAVSSCLEARPHVCWCDCDGATKYVKAGTALLLELMLHQSCSRTDAASVAAECGPCGSYPQGCETAAACDSTAELSLR